VPVVGRHFIRAALSALAIAREIGLTPEEINVGFQNFKSVSGRCEVQQIGSWTVIDDSYNANPESMRAACQTLHDWNAQHRRLLITGDMLELGEHSAQSHFEIGLNAAQAGIDLLLAYGEHADDVIRGAMSGGLPANRLAQCDHFEVLLTALDCLLDSEDVLLVKGSRGMRMERVVDWLKHKSVANPQTLTPKP
jgi:UDP-N-acetylmuramoyl-tripeptide--D-alanyl-D-alanine ligase